MTGNQPGVKFVIHCYDSCSITCISSLFQAFRSWERGRRRKEMFRQKKNCEVGRGSLLSSFLPAKDFSPGLRQLFHVARYHLGKVKLERVGQRSSPTSVCDLRGGPRGIAGLLVCPFSSVALHCSLLIVADQFLPSCESLRILAPSPPSLPGGLVNHQFSQVSISTEFIQCDGAG